MKKLPLLLILLTLNACSTAPKGPAAPESVAVITAQDRTASATVAISKSKSNVDTARTSLESIESKALKAIEISKQIEALSE